MNDISLITTSILGGCGLLITFIYNYHSRKLDKDRMNKELFSEFNKRYDVLNDYLYQITTTCKTLEDLNKQPLLKYKLNDYYNLCAEEYYWFNKNRIDEKVWDSWEAGMNCWYSDFEIIKLGWKQELKENGHKSFYLKKNEQFFKD